MNLLELLPPFYHSSAFVQALMDAETLEYEKLRESIDDLVANLYINTATWGLDYFEQELGITVDKRKSYEERRERLLAKKRGQGTTTLKMLKNTAEAFSGGEVEITEFFDQYSFNLKFVGTKGVPRNISDFMATIEEIKPAHLSYTLEFVYSTHRELSALTHNKLNAYTHKQIKEAVTIGKLHN